MIPPPLRSSSDTCYRRSVNRHWSRRGSTYSSEHIPQVAEEGVFDAIVSKQVAISVCTTLEDYVK